MKRLLGLIALLAVALLGAWGWRALAADPGYVQIVWRGWSIESTLVVAVAVLVGIWLILWVLVLALRFPQRWWRRRRRHVARECLAGGLVALHEGRWRRAEKLLLRAAGEPQHRLPALLGAVRAAQARGDAVRASELLAEAAERGDPIAATLLAARQHRRRGDAAAITSLFDPQPVAALPPRALELYLDALVDTGRAQEAFALLPALRSSAVLEGAALQREEARIVAAALEQADQGETLDRLWAGLSRAQKVDPVVVAAYARRSVVHGRAEAGIDAVEKALRRHWSPELVAVYGWLPREGRHSPLKMAEAWLADHPDDPALLVALGRLCRSESLWGKAEAYLRRALAQGAGADAWEELGHVHAAEHNDARARDAFAQALALHRGEAAFPVESPRSLRDQIAGEAVAETRSSMGVPVLPRDEEDTPPA